VSEVREQACHIRAPATIREEIIDPEAVFFISNETRFLKLLKMLGQGRLGDSQSGPQTHMRLCWSILTILILFGSEKAFIVFINSFIPHP
jgi:hypothetical protein